MAKDGYFLKKLLVSLSIPSECAERVYLSSTLKIAVFSSDFNILLCDKTRPRTSESPERVYSNFSSLGRTRSARYYIIAYLNFELLRNDRHAIIPPTEVGVVRRKAETI